MKDSSFEKIKKYKKYKDIFDLQSLEFRCSLITSLIIAAIMWNISKFMTDENINSLLIVFTKDIAIAFICFLGFSVSALAILTGVISKKDIDKMSKADVMEQLDKILLSFYWLGLVIGSAIVINFILYIFSMSTLERNQYVFTVVSFFMCYIDTYIVFYAIKLIGNCLEVFFIVNSITEEAKKGTTQRIAKEIYDGYRITALESVCLKHLGQDGLIEYNRIVRDQVNDSTDYAEELKQMYESHFNIKNS
jgi:signal transduction histidine kinase